NCLSSSMRASVQVACAAAGLGLMFSSWIRRSASRPAMQLGAGRIFVLYYSIYVSLWYYHLLNGSLEPTLKRSAAMARKRQPDSRNDIGERLRVTREALGLSQAELCRRIGTSPAAWNNA